MDGGHGIRNTMFVDHQQVDVLAGSRCGDGYGASLQGLDCLREAVGPIVNTDSAQAEKCDVVRQLDMTSFLQIGQHDIAEGLVRNHSHAARFNKLKEKEGDVVRREYLGCRKWSGAIGHATGCKSKEPQPPSRRDRVDSG